MSDEEKQAFFSKVTEIGTKPLPNFDELRVATLVSLSPVISIADIDAAYRLDVSDSDACFAMDPNDVRFIDQDAP